MCFGSRPIESVTFPQESDVLPNWFVDFLREKTIFPQKNWKSSRKSSKQVTTTTTNPGNRRGFFVEIIKDFALFSLFFIFSLFHFSLLPFLFFFFFFFFFSFFLFFLFFFLHPLFLFLFLFFQSSEQTPKPAKIVEKFQF